MLHSNFKIFIFMLYCYFQWIFYFDAYFFWYSFFLIFTLAFVDCLFLYISFFYPITVTFSLPLNCSHVFYKQNTKTKFVFNQLEMHYTFLVYLDIISFCASFLFFGSFFLLNSVYSNGLSSYYSLFFFYHVLYYFNEYMQILLKPTVNQVLSLYLIKLRSS